MRLAAAWGVVLLLAGGLLGVITWAAWDSARWAGIGGFWGGIVLVSGLVWALWTICEYSVREKR